MEAVVLDIESRPLVHDAAIVQKRSCQQNLAVMANPIISDEYARQLADNFVRLTKALGLGPNPTREIGKGVYDYFVGVFDSGTRERIAMGFKDARSRRITW